MAKLTIEHVLYNANGTLTKLVTKHIENLSSEAAAAIAAKMNANASFGRPKPGDTTLSITYGDEVDTAINPTDVYVREVFELCRTAIPKEDSSQPLSPKSLARVSHPWTSEEETELQRLRATGSLTNKEIGKRLKEKFGHPRPESSVRRHLDLMDKKDAKRKGRKPNRSPSPGSKWTSKEDTELRRLHKLGKTHQEISNAMHKKGFSRTANGVEHRLRMFRRNSA